MYIERKLCINPCDKMGHWCDDTHTNDHHNCACWHPPSLPGEKAKHAHQDNQAHAQKQILYTLQKLTLKLLEIVEKEGGLQVANCRPHNHLFVPNAEIAKMSTTQILVPPRLEKNMASTANAPPILERCSGAEVQQCHSRSPNPGCRGVEEHLYVKKTQSLRYLYVLLRTVSRLNIA
jgi:hypothetical protein